MCFTMFFLLCVNSANICEVAIFHQQINNMALILTLLDLIAFVQYFLGSILLLNQLPVKEKKIVINMVIIAA